MLNPREISFAAQEVEERFRQATRRERSGRRAKNFAIHQAVRWNPIGPIPRAEDRASDRSGGVGVATLLNEVHE